MEKKKDSTSHSQTQLENSELWCSENNTIFGNSGEPLKPYGVFNDQNNRLLQIYGNSTGRYGLPVLSFVKTSHKHDYGGQIMWLSDNLNNPDKRFAQLSGHIKDKGGYFTFNTRKESDEPGYFNSMIFNENGNVGIGTADPEGWRLAVNGKIKAQEVNLDSYSGNSVFKEGYDLPDLKKVEDQIKNMGHLKDLPSTQDLEKNGIPLGELSFQLLLKVEELTLYIIQQHKEIEELKSSVKELSKTNN
ncbi:hypothetical protein LVD13_05655 [Flavobacteriaceae bacterium D16]|nr:hypothetical protein [Flavobacteriaceae bacterium D16]